MTKWTKPSGVVVELNDELETRKKAIDLGWRTDAMIADDKKSTKKSNQKELKANVNGN